MPAAWPNPIRMTMYSATPTTPAVAKVSGIQRSSRRRMSSSNESRTAA